MTKNVATQNLKGYKCNILIHVRVNVNSFGGSTKQSSKYSTGRGTLRKLKHAHAEADEHQTHHRGVEHRLGPAADTMQQTIFTM